MNSLLVHMQDSTRYDKTQKLLEKYDPDYEVPTPRKLPPAPLPRQVTPGPMTPLPHQVGHCSTLPHMLAAAGLLRAMPCSGLGREQAPVVGLSCAIMQP